MGFFDFGGARGASVMTADEVEAARFTQTRFREGYDLGEVDAFLARCAATIRGKEGGPQPTDPVSAEDVVAVRFRPTKFREGYDQDQVDDLLDRVVATLRAEPAGA